MQSIDPASGSITGPAGRGVQIGIFDSGIDEDHEDFRSRIILNDHVRRAHATHVAGVVAGSGIKSNGVDSWNMPNKGAPYQWSGMAPLAELLDVSRVKANTPVGPGRYISQYGMDLSNHSYGLSYDGSYDRYNALTDSLIRGNALAGGEPVPPRLQVHSSGNHGLKALNGGVQIGYFSLTRQVKNALVVGNYDYSNSAISARSSLGPTYDGRIKPDLVAPGTDIMSTGYCEKDTKDPCKSYPAGESMHRNWYVAQSGSSFAAGAVTGGLALVLEQYAVTYGVELDRSPPLPSTLRGVAIHSAQDLAGGPWLENVDGPVAAFPGPDFVTGWGLLDVEQAVLAVQGQEIIEDSLGATCDSLGFTLQVDSQGPLKVTLAWDDPPAQLGQRSSTPLLVNDLDLVLVAPDGRRHWPWLLDQVVVDGSGIEVADDQQACGVPVGVRRRALAGPPEAKGLDPVRDAFQPAGRGRDHLNNVEQVLVESPDAGTWQVWVVGFKIPAGPQRFSLIGVPARASGTKSGGLDGTALVK